MRRSLLSAALCILLITTVACGVSEVRGKPSADFSNRTVTVEQGSSFSQTLTLEGRNTDYKNLKIHFRMPDGVSSTDAPNTETLEEGEEWTVRVTFRVATTANPGTYTVVARGEWEEFNEDVDGWEGNEGELTKFTLIVEEKSADSSDSEEEEGTGISFSDPMILGISGLGVIAVAAGTLFYYRSKQRTESPRPLTPTPREETAVAEEPTKEISCKYCGSRITCEAAYCRNCGKKISG